MRGKDRKIVKVEIENAEGKIEKFKMSYPLAQILADRIVKPGWPWRSIKLNGQEIVSKPDPCYMNVYRDKEGKEFIL